MAFRVNSMIDVETKGESNISYLLRVAPETFRRQVELWLWREKVAFVGSSKKDGKFTKELANKPRKYRSGNWSKYIARSFTGVIDNARNLDAMRLRMGLVKGDRKKNVSYLEALGYGANITPKNSEWLMVPNYKNLMSTGLYGKYGAKGKNSFSKLLNNLYGAHITPVLYHGKLLMFGDFPDKGGSHAIRHQRALDRKLLFTGVKKTSVPRQFNFEASWSKRLPSIEKHGKTMVARTIRSLERGYLKAE